MSISVSPTGKKPGNVSSMIASGYYLTFFMGGFITPAARQARSNILPLLPPASNPNVSPSLLKFLSDLARIILSILNYAASPFILLSAEDPRRRKALLLTIHTIPCDFMLPDLSHTRQSPMSTKTGASGLPTIGDDPYSVIIAGVLCDPSTAQDHVFLEDVLWPDFNGILQDLQPRFAESLRKRFNRYFVLEQIMSFQASAI